MKKISFSDMTTHTRVVLGITVAVLFALAVFIVVLCIPFFQQLSNPEYQQQFKSWVESIGVFGFLVMLLIQIAQIVIAFIPGEVVQVLGGAMYGTWGGLGLCLLGCIIASSVVFLVIRRLGKDFVVKLFGEENLQRFDFLNNTEKLETIVFVLFLIPGMPKDVLTYIVPLSNISFKSFIVLSNLGRIPGLLASTLIGSSIAEANWPLIVAVFIVVGVVGGLSIWKRGELMEWIKRLGAKSTQTAASDESNV